MRWIKRILEGTVIDVVLNAVYRGIKAMMIPAARTAAEKAAGDIGEAAFSKFKNILDPEFVDEQEISKAMKFLDYRELQSWNEKIADIDVLCTENGVVNVSLAGKIKDTVRCLTVRETPVQTANEMKYVAGMPDEVWRAHISALSLVERFKHEKWQSFKNWTGENATSMWQKVSENRTELNEMIETAAQDMCSWVDRYIKSRQ